LKSFLIAAGVALAGSLAMVGWSCHAESRDTCLIAQGIAPYVGAGLLLVLWPLVAGTRIIVRALKPRPPGG
jgi:hypothetical protein